MEKRNHNTAELIKIFLICLCVVLFIAPFFIQQKKRHINEAKKLPFTNTNLELVEDGTYENSTFTSFMHLSLEVTVKNHQLFQIKVIENNKVVNSLVEGDEIGNLVFISCVDGALRKGIKKE